MIVFNKYYDKREYTYDEDMDSTIYTVLKKGSL